MKAIAKRLIPLVEELRDHALALERAHETELAEVPEEYQQSARNLLHYLAVRQTDIRDLQGELAALGLSSLGRLEAHALRSLEAVLEVLIVLSGDKVKKLKSHAPVTFRTGLMLLQEHTRRLFGPVPANRQQRIMVTMPSEAAEDGELIEKLLLAGTDVIRINCAHDGPEVWRAMIDNLRAAERHLGRRCKVHADLAGPKLRTGSLAAGTETVKLLRGDMLTLVLEGRNPAAVAPGGHGDAVMPCSLEAVFGMVREGERISFDDGKIGGIIRAIDAEGIHVEITRAKEEGSKLKAEKGINLPDTHIELPALNDKDFADLALLAPHVDLIGMSFVRSSADVLQLQERLAELKASHVGIVLKIENRAAFEALPSLLLAALRSPPVGIMVARGDLAAELGFERLAEAQEEILWLCEAAHVPVIWATQVLENMTKTGLPSRAEVTDAAMSQRAECVMLNKGPYIVRTVSFLDDILTRMQAHHYKKQATLRKLAVSQY